MSDPSRTNLGCGLSRTTKTMSAGIKPGTWSPSRGNVMRVPAFQPGRTSIVSIFSSDRVVCPSSDRTFRVIFIFFDAPCRTSSSETRRSRVTAGSWRRWLLLRRKPPSPPNGLSSSTSIGSASPKNIFDRLLPRPAPRNRLPKGSSPAPPPKGSFPPPKNIRNISLGSPLNVYVKEVPPVGPPGAPPPPPFFRPSSPTCSATQTTDRQRF